MPRKKLYYTKEARHLADCQKRDKRLRYYYKNADSINAKLRKDYSAAKCEWEKTDARKRKQKAAARAQKEATTLRQEQATSLLKQVETRYAQFIDNMQASSPSRYFDAVYVLSLEADSSGQFLEKQCGTFSAISVALEKHISDILELVGPDSQQYTLPLGLYFLHKKDEDKLYVCHIRSIYFLKHEKYMFATQNRFTLPLKNL
ncbi:hypothetical protein K435DRAFT_861804 [Dendrothele bispora CBS 962.96]|uniref:Uncharacterized protein n=1 Tax=Dendrothele bispora (strain CBS 962.96) TaxID=1314807 RepID=A0A4S8LVF4_DENBC|nr:hypothetical protein K435DRAFT_861804 [Dendrothele bispora CBS 962.96]